MSSTCKSKVQSTNSVSELQIIFISLYQISAIKYFGIFSSLFFKIKEKLAISLFLDV